MINVMIVDDNTNIVKGLKILIDWEELGFSVAATAKNAYEAIDAMKKNKIDVVITNIRMPEMSGLELLKYLRENHPDITLITISGYDEFEYAQKAIAYGVKGYLLKPIEEEELISLLKSVREDAEIKKREKVTRINYYINTLLSGNEAECDAYSEMFKGNIAYFMIFRRSDVITNIDDYNSEVSLAVYNAVRKCPGVKEELVIKNSYGETELAEVSDKLDFASFAQRIYEYVRERVSEDIYIFCGKCVKNIKNIMESKKSISDLLPLAFYAVSKRIFIYDTAASDFKRTLSDESVISRIISDVERGESENAVNAINALKKQLRTENVLPDSAALYVQNILFEFNNMLPEKNYDLLKYINRLSIIGKQRIVTLDMLISFLTETVSEICDEVLKTNQINKMGIVGKAIEYVEDNYGDKELKLQTIANMYFVNAAYFGQVFKQKTGKTFNNYLSEKRIEKAKKLLADSGMRLYEIADSVGFADPNYFSAKFSEMEGMSPTVYRQMHKK